VQRCRTVRKHEPSIYIIVVIVAAAITAAAAATVVVVVLAAAAAAAAWAVNMGSKISPASCAKLKVVDEQCRVVHVFQTLVQIQKFKKHLTGIKIRYGDWPVYVALKCSLLY